VASGAVPAARKADYGELVAPYLRTMDDDVEQAAGRRSLGASQAVPSSPGAEGSLID
jgi:hypothetical protein